MHAGLPPKCNLMISPLTMIPTLAQMMGYEDKPRGDEYVIFVIHSYDDAIAEEIREALILDHKIYLLLARGMTPSEYQPLEDLLHTYGKEDVNLNANYGETYNRSVIWGRWPVHLDLPQLEGNVAYHMELLPRSGKQSGLICHMGDPLQTDDWIRILAAKETPCNIVYLIVPSDFSLGALPISNALYWYYLQHQDANGNNMPVFKHWGDMLLSLQPG